MDTLYTYVAAIHGRPGTPLASAHAVEKSSWHDQGFEVTREVTDYRFENAVLIRRTIEQDHFPGALACAECWITYEVIAAENRIGGIQPMRKVFENACRESFWLAYHMA